jgi:hypothetical protein
LETSKPQPEPTLTQFYLSAQVKLQKDTQQGCSSQQSKLAP